MDYLENKYLVLPLHHKVSINEAKFISKLLIDTLNKYLIFFVNGSEGRIEPPTPGL